GHVRRGARARGADTGRVPRRPLRAALLAGLAGARTDQCHRWRGTGPDPPRAQPPRAGTGCGGDPRDAADRARTAGGAGRAGAGGLHGFHPAVGRTVCLADRRRGADGRGQRVAAVAVVGAGFVFMAPDRARGHHPRRRPHLHVRARRGRDWPPEPGVGRVHGAVRRTGRGFRHPVQRAPARAPTRRGCIRRRAARHGGRGDRADRPGRAGNGLRVPRVRTDPVHRRRRTRHHRRRRHADRAAVHVDDPAGAADAAGGRGGATTPLAAGGLWGVLTIRFDANPLHTQRADSEAMRTLTSLQGNPNTDPFTINVVVPDLAAARTLGDRLGRLPEVAQVVSGADFIPQHQAAKLAQIQQASYLMFTVTAPPATAPAPSMAELRQAAQHSHAGIAAVKNQLASDSPLLRIGESLGRLAAAPTATVRLANDALTRFLPVALTQLKEALSATPITFKGLPANLKRNWFTPDGRVRVQVTPTAQAQTTAGLRQFVHAVRTIAPTALGPAIDTLESAQTILRSFREAALYATLAIAVVLLIVLRNIRDAALVLATLAMSALLTALFARLGGMSIDYANIIALPLLLGVGVSFNVYFVMNWRSGSRLFL